MSDQKEAADTSLPLPVFPVFAPIDIALQDECEKILHKASGGISELTFAGLYLFRRRYNYRLSVLLDSVENPEVKGRILVVSGEWEGKKFFILSPSAPGIETIKQLFTTHDYWKLIPESVINSRAAQLSAGGMVLTEDRDNFDYIYTRESLATLAGKKLQKKRNLVNAFRNTYGETELRTLGKDNAADAMRVLLRWQADKGEEGDFAAAKEALELQSRLKLEGKILYVRNKPIAYCLGEAIADGSMFTVHFEKGIEEYKGVYQAINMFFAASLDEAYTHINREQDLGEEGMRQAKETYRPCGFVKKWIASNPAG
ncbi:MAG: phosphatidylglycerol lysyltransferase domain-containing protein [Treponema sp.]|nr:phosphatidylglycerol lysyltransferase domain-containing protein [Treponema sp.]